MKLTQHIIKKIMSLQGRTVESLYGYLMTCGYEEPKPRVAHYPLLSGDTFMNMCDVAYLRSQQTASTVRYAGMKSLVFVEGDRVELSKNLEYLQDFAGIIYHNADRPPEERLIRFAQTKKIHLFATNIVTDNVFIHNIPIGLENAHLRRNGSMHYYNALNGLLNGEKGIEEALMVSFSTSSNQFHRNRVEQLCKAAGLINRRYKTAKDYRSALSQSYFTISPPGNGIDCHRTWEAIYHGSIPVIERMSYIYDSDIELPIYICENYEDFLRLSASDKTDIYKSIMSNNYPAIYLDWWVSRIRELISR